MAKSIRIAPPHPQMYVLDSGGGDIPEWKDHPFLSTPSCIMFRCRPSIDGETDITLGLASHVNPGESPAFDGHLETPSKLVIIETSEQDLLLSQPVESETTRVRIWKNDEWLADKVIVGLG